MRFYNNNNGDEDREDSGDMDDLFGRFEEADDENDPVGDMEVLELVDMELANAELNTRILEQAIRVCETSWFWRFKSVKKKIIAIREVYYHLSLLIDEEE